MQYFPAFALTLFWTVNELQCSDRINNTSGHIAKLVVTPKPAEGVGIRPIILGKIEQPLNLTCRVVHQRTDRNDIRLSDDTFPSYAVSWKTSDQNENRNLLYRASKIKGGQGENSAWLWFERLSEAHAGDYRCHAVAMNPMRQPSVFTDIHLSVKNQIAFCGSGWFKCHSARCLMLRHLCDGVRDCQDGEDETEMAGCNAENPCHGKVICGERCLPAAWCCNLGHCNTSHPEPPNVIATDQQRFNDMGFLQTTIYTVIGCAMAFMFIVTILVIMICRVHMKRAMNSRCPPQIRNPGSRPRHSVPLYDLDVYLNRAADLNNQGVTVTYNINNSVQFVGRPIEPPPYSEIAPVPPREGPPPPYVSRENLLDFPVAERIASTRSSNSPAQTSGRNGLIAPFINRDNSSTRNAISCRNNPNVTSTQCFSSGQIPGPQATPGFSRFDLSLNSDDASNTTLNSDDVSNTTLNTSDSIALHTSSNSDSSSNNSVNNFVICRNITSHSQNFEPEYTETDSLLSEIQRDTHLQVPERIVRIAENPFAYRSNHPNAAQSPVGDSKNDDSSATQSSFTRSSEEQKSDYAWDSDENTDRRSSNSSENEASFLDCERQLSCATKDDDSRYLGNKDINTISDHSEIDLNSSGSSTGVLPVKKCSSKLVIDNESVVSESSVTNSSVSGSTVRSLPFFSYVDSLPHISEDLANKNPSTSDNDCNGGLVIVNRNFVKRDVSSCELESNLVPDVDEKESASAPSQEDLGKSIEKNTVFENDRSGNGQNLHSFMAASNDEKTCEVDVPHHSLSYNNSGTDPSDDEKSKHNFKDKTSTFSRDTLPGEDQSRVLALRESFIGVSDPN